MVVLIVLLAAVVILVAHSLVIKRAPTLKPENIGIKSQVCHSLAK